MGIIKDGFGNIIYVSASPLFKCYVLFVELLAIFKALKIYLNKGHTKI